MAVCPATGAGCSRELGRSSYPTADLTCPRPASHSDAPMCQGSGFRRCWQASDGPLGSRAGSYEAMRCRRWLEGGPAYRSKDSRVASGRYWARPALRSVSGVAAARLRGRRSLEDADDLGLGEALVEAALDVGAGAGVRAHAGDHDPPEGVVGLAVAAAVEAVSVVRPEDAWRGATPQRLAQAASLRSRLGLSPAATRRVAAVSGPTPWG